MFRFLKIFLAPCLLLVFVCLPIQAQTVNATLSGVVEDEKGAVIPGVKVTITNPATGFESSVITNSSGAYVIPLLPPATYTVTAEQTGFTRVQFPDIVLNVNDVRSLRIQLKVGSVEAAIEVRPDASMVDTSPGVSTTIDRTFVQNLPLNGRSFQSLILLTPGVTVTGGLGGFSVNGQRSNTNYFTVDGVSANIGLSPSIGIDTTLGGAYPGTNAFGGSNNLISVDALEEYKIQTSTYSAELGRQTGGQVSLVTRSGTNQFHGTIFEYFRNEALDARDYFNMKPAPKPALRQNQFGGTFSGPLFFPNSGDGGSRLYNGRDRTFFFFSYEGQRLRLPISGVTQVPSIRVRAAAAAAVKPILNAFAQPTGPEILTTIPCPVPPAPPNPACDPTTNRLFSGWSPYNYNISSPSTGDATSIRIDQTFNSKLILFGRFNESPANRATFARLDGGAYSNVTETSTRTLTLGATSVLTPRLHNELRFNYSRQLGFLQYVPNTDGGAVPVDPAVLTNGLGGTGNAVFSYRGFFGQVLAGDVVKNYQRQLNIVDNISLIRGAHQFKFGIDYRRLSPTYGVQDSQTVIFSSEAGISSAIPRATAIISKNDSARPRFTNLSVYGQDTWKVSKRLTLDLGLRWEFNPAPTEVDGKQPAAVIGVTGTDVSGAILAPAGTPFYKTFYTAFAPRLGAAYQLRTKAGHETVLRGGFGVYYDLGSSMALAGLPLKANKILPNVPFPLSATNAARPPVVVPTSLPVLVTVSSNDENLKLPYTLQWNVAVEQSFGANQSLSLSYVASAARRLVTQSILNFADPITGLRANSNFRTITYVRNGPTSDYNSLQAQYKVRLKRGLQALVNYTWAHAIDEASDDSIGSIFVRGNADFDIRHNLSTAFTYDLPSPKVTPVVSHVLRGWSINGIVHAQSGMPINVTGTGTLLLEGAFQSIRPDVVPGQPFYISDTTVPGGRRFNSSAFQAPPTICVPAGSPTCTNVPARQGNFGRNVLRGLSLFQTDLGLSRNFKLTENVKMQFKGEVFNIFNHPMFGAYGTVYTSPSTFGVPTLTLGRSLGGLNALYQIGGPRSIQLSLRLSF